MQYLVFQLYGPMVSWGNIAVGGTRPSHAYPTKSAVLGLLAAAQGISRHEEEQLQMLEKDISFAVQIDSQGQLMIDYHTAQVPTQKALKNRPHMTRKDELTAPELSTVLSQREYYGDALYTVVLWTKEKKDLLNQLSNALKKPHYIPYLGRKSCPMGLPIVSQLYNTDTIEQALDVYHNDDVVKNMHQMLRFIWTKQKPQQALRLYTDLDGKMNQNHHHTITRRDGLLNRKRWQFSERKENVVFLTKEQEQ
ncbi:MAG: type I-E CRISPR-associated protein Cas5/CasD [Legionellales bacterium]|jgi:CRISPR system Cascade subunit CasD